MRQKQNTDFYFFPSPFPLIALHCYYSLSVMQENLVGLKDVPEL